MGQYYHPVILDEDKTTILSYLSSYNYGNGAKLMEHSYILNNLVMAFESLILGNPKHVIWAGDYADNEPDCKWNINGMCSEELYIQPPTPKITGKYIVNHSKNLFVTKVTGKNMEIHPLPLLICEGNGRGGGDYRGKDPNKLIGSWSRDLISIEKTKPKKPFKELLLSITEDEILIVKKLTKKEIIEKKIIDSNSFLEDLKIEL